VSDLRSTYLGIELRSPIVASAGPLTGKIDTLQELADAGVGAVVLPSLFEEQLGHDPLAIERMLFGTADSNPEAADGYFPVLEDYYTGPGPYLQLVEQAKSKLEVPVIASLNGITDAGLASYAQLLQQAGADAIELNVYLVASDPDHDAAHIERRYRELIAAVRSAIGIPLAVKVSPFFSAFAHTARDLVTAGANGLVLFNRFYQPDIDIETLTVTPSLDLSRSAELRLSLRWIAILSRRLPCSLAATGGVHTAGDVVKAILAGADVAMTTSALLQHGTGHVAALESGLRQWMAEHEFDSVEQMKGSLSQQAVPDPEGYDRANYMRTLMSYSTW
jgi:dihydroorotate dehydrogenase (fumarate)